MAPDAIIEAIRSHSLMWLFGLAVFEGPIVSVGAGWLARLGDVSLWSAFIVLIIADLVGDFGLYMLGRSGLDKVPNGLRKRLKLTDDNLSKIADHFRHNGGRTLVLGKITHSLGFAVLVAAGVGRMNIGAFLWYNLLGTIPKSLFFLLLGYFIGNAMASIDVWLWRATIFLGVVCVTGLALWWARKRGG